MSNENFAEMFAQSETQRPRLPKPGDKVSGTVTSVGARNAVLDLGNGVDGMIELIALPDPPAVGDRIDGHVLAIENRIVHVGRSIAKGATLQVRMPVEGTVKEVNKGGYVVDVNGTRCFCPLGQMDLRRIEDPNVMIGKKLTFMVTEVKERDVVLSRRVLLEADAKEKREKTLATLQVGARLSGTITSVRDFGAFVDLGGVDGLIPVSEMAWARVNAGDIVKVGQSVDVEVLKIDGERISLSMKALQEKPEQPKREVVPLPAVGTVVDATVDRIETFGVFVTFPGGRGLVPASDLGEGLRKKYPVGTVFKAQLVEVRQDGKIRLSKTAAEGAEERADADAFLKSQGSSGFGSLAEKLQRALKK